MDKHTQQLFENQQAIAAKMKLQSRQISVLHQQLSGLTTALIGAGVLTEEGVDLHQSFTHKATKL